MIIRGFYGMSTSDLCDVMLTPSDLGTYVVRFSSHKLEQCCLTIQVKKTPSEISKYNISTQRKNSIIKYSMQNLCFDSLGTLIEEVSLQLLLINPCNFIRDKSGYDMTSHFMRIGQSGLLPDVESETSQDVALF